MNYFLKIVDEACDHGEPILYRLEQAESSSEVNSVG